MKFILYIIFSIFTLNTTAQCTDIFGSTVECPTENDSLVVYNNALKVYEFYEKSPNYTKLKTQRLRTRQDVVNCFYLLQDAVDSFQIRWQLRERVLRGEDLQNVLLPRDGKNIPISSYYQYIDANRFYQRELESGILNITSPFPIYDNRIAPLIINSYENRHGTDEYNGDFVNIALYIPVTVKPFRLLSDSEKIVRQNILDGIIPRKAIANPIKSRPVKKVKRVIEDTTLLESATIDYKPPVIIKASGLTGPPSNGIPLYYQMDYGGGWLMGWMVGRKFRKFLPTDEFYWSLPVWLKDFLNNDKELEKYLKIKFGGYYDGIYN